MTKTANDLLPLLGLNTTGDLGPYTIYKSQRGVLVFYPRMPALNPPSPMQTIQRAKWAAAAAGWRAQPPTTRRQWEAAAKKAGLKITGYNLWIYSHSKPDARTYRTVSTQSGIPLSA
jgi:hypothetical protein